VTLGVERGSLVGVLGPNGSGKTTLLRMLSGTLVPQSGRVTLDGVDIGRMSRPAIARRMAVVPQETHLAFDYSVLEIVLMGATRTSGRSSSRGPATSRWPARHWRRRARCRSSGARTPR